MEAQGWNEAGRALVLWGALQVDLVRRSPDEAERQPADDLLGLLTPVIKGYLTDKGFEAAVNAQQVSAATATSASTASSSSSAMRASPRSTKAPTASRRWTSSAASCPRTAAARSAHSSSWSARDIAEAKAAGDPAGVAAALEPALADLQAATMWLAQNGMADPDNAGAGAYAYMDLMGLVSLGWMWLKMAAASSRALAEGADDRAFHEAKLATARFYAARELPLSTALRAEDRSGRREPHDDTRRGVLDFVGVVRRLSASNDAERPALLRPKTRAPRPSPRREPSDPGPTIALRQLPNVSSIADPPPAPGHFYHRLPDRR